MKQFEGTRAECMAIVAAIDSREDYPRRHRVRRRTRKPRRASPASWDGQNETPPRWTRTYATPEEHPASAGLWSVPIEPYVRAQVIGVAVGGRVVRRRDIVERDAAWDVFVEPGETP